MNWEELGGPGLNREEPVRTSRNWVELRGTGRKLGESVRNWVDLGGTWWIWVVLGGTEWNWVVIGRNLGGTE